MTKRKITDISAGEGGYGLRSSGYNKKFRALDKPIRDRILAMFAPKTGERAKVQPNVPYPCPANNPFKGYTVLIDGDDHASIRHKKHTDKPLKPSRNGQVKLYFTNASDGSRQKRMVSYRKVVFSFVYPEWCMEQFNVDMFNPHGQSCGMIHVDHIDEVAMGGTDLDRVSNWQLLIARDNTLKSHVINKTRHVKKGQTQSRAFRLCLVGGGKQDEKDEGREEVKESSYQSFNSTEDPAIKAFVRDDGEDPTTANTHDVHRGHLCAMLNGKQKKVGVRGRQGYFVVAHPDDVRDQGQQRADFGGRALSPAIIETLGKNFTDQTSACKLLFHADGRVYGNKGQIARGKTNSREQYNLMRMYNNEYMHTLVYYAHCDNALAERQRQETNDLVIAHKEQNPLTYLLFPCNPKTRAIAHHALPLPDMTFDAFKALSDTEQRSIRVLYSNHAETLRLDTQSENRQESAQSRLDLTQAPHSYQIHVHQLDQEKQKNARVGIVQKKPDTGW
jgi:hypothetical protein